MAKAAPVSLAGKKTADTRDTCVTRLAAADISLLRISHWTGRSPKGIETILRNHYLVLREQGASKTGRQLQAYADAQGLAP